MTKSNQDAPAQAARFYLAAWRWHFYAGLCVLPFIVVLALSGLAMLVSEPLDRYRQAELLTVTPAGARLSASEQAAAVMNAYPHADVATFRATPSASDSTRIDVVPKHATAGHGGHGATDTLAVFVDPYSGAVLGDAAPDATLYAWAKSLHGTLLLGATGDYLIEIVAGFGVLLIVSGVYLWWPRANGRARESALSPAVVSKRRRWRNLHGTLGVATTPFLLFFLVSGLAWTPFWGGELVQTWSSLPGETFDAPLARTAHGSLDHDAHRDVPWTVEQTPLPASGSQRGARGIAVDGELAIDDVIGYAQASGFSTFRVHWPRGEDGVWTIATTTIAGDTRDPAGDRIVHLDRMTGNVLADIGFADYPPMGKLMAAGVPLHQADTGLGNLVVNVFVCIAVLGLCAAAVAAWWARRPSGSRRLLPPPLPRDERVWRTAVLLMLVLSLAFPLVAATIAVVVALDALLLSRVRRLRLLFE